VSFQDGLLTVQGERRPVTDSAEERAHLTERRYGPFRRSITLPQHVVGTAIEASSEADQLSKSVPPPDLRRGHRFVGTPSAR
jgi:HSP20 family protein